MQVGILFPFEYNDTLYYAERLIDPHYAAIFLITQFFDAGKINVISIASLSLPLILTRQKDGTWGNDNLGRLLHQGLIQSIAFGLEISLESQVTII